jgi:hypothetical protein
MLQPPRRVGYILYVDEFGDDGFQTVRPIDPRGGSEWMVLSGVLVHEKNYLRTGQWVRDFKSGIKGATRPDLHFADLSDRHRIRACQFLAKQHVRCFSITSNKRNMRGYRNLRAERHDTRNPFYNWMLRLLLERASSFCADRSIRDYGEMRALRIELAARGGLTLARLKPYLWYKLRRQGQAGTTYLKRGQISWDVINPEEIDVVQAKKSSGIQLADVVASAFGQAIDVKPDGTLCTAYAEALRPIVATTQRGRAADYGVKLMPDPPAVWELGLNEQQVRFFELFGYSRRYLLGPHPGRI